MEQRNGALSNLPRIKGVNGLTQIAVITRDTEKMANQLSESLDIGSFKLFTAKQPELFNSSYDNKPENWAMKAGLTWLGSMQIEIIQPIAGRTVYDDYLNARSQKAGIEHIFFATEDYEGTKKHFAQLGYGLKQEAQLNAAGKMGIFPIPALPSFLKHLAAKFGYTSTIDELKIDIEVAKFPKGVSQKVALKAAIPEKWIPESKSILFEETPEGSPLGEVDRLFILCEDLDVVVSNYAKLTDRPPTIEDFEPDSLPGKGRISKITVGNKLLVLVQPVEGDLADRLATYGEGLSVLGAIPKVNIEKSITRLKELGWGCSTYDNCTIANHVNVPFAILVSA